MVYILSKLFFNINFSHQILLLLCRGPIHLPAKLILLLGVSYAIENDILKNFVLNFARKI